MREKGDPLGGFLGTSPTFADRVDATRGELGQPAEHRDTWAPPDWPARVSPPDVPGWQDSAVRWLRELDHLPPGYAHRHLVLREQPFLLARTARLQYAASLQFLRSGHATTRVDLRGSDHPVHVVEEALACYVDVGSDVADRYREIVAVEEALRRDVLLRPAAGPEATSARRGPAGGRRRRLSRYLGRRRGMTIGTDATWDGIVHALDDPVLRAQCLQEIMLARVVDTPALAEKWARVAADLADAKARGAVLAAHVRAHGVLPADVADVTELVAADAEHASHRGRGAA
ncbi:hypothetical protein ACU686_26370 [Yinghuangia aomiensis]